MRECYYSGHQASITTEFNYGVVVVVVVHGLRHVAIARKFQGQTTLRTSQSDEYMSQKRRSTSASPLVLQLESLEAPQVLGGGGAHLGALLHPPHDVHFAHSKA